MKKEARGPGTLKKGQPSDLSPRLVSHKIIARHVAKNVKTTSRGTSFQADMQWGEEAFKAEPRLIRIHTNIAKGKFLK